MNSRAFTLSLVLAAIAVFMVYAFIENKEAEYKQRYGMESSVVIAKEDINEMEILDDRKLELSSVPQKYLAPGHFKNPEDLYNTIAAVPIKKGEQITRPRITYPGERSGLARQVAIGKRAMAFKIDNYTAVGKLIKPGDRVDVLAMIDFASGRRDKQKIITALQDVLVLSTGLNITNSIPLIGVKVEDSIRGLNLSHYTNYDSITLELTPYEVQKMAFILTTGGNLYFSLRNNDDKTQERISGTKLFDVLGEEAMEAKNYFDEVEAINQKRLGK